MAKIKKVFQCNNCDNRESGWLGRCPQCGEWNTLVEITPVAKGKPRSESRSIEISALNKISVEDDFRVNSGITEINRVLGGGIMKGASILIGGEPGIGKSTLMLQTAAAASKHCKILYISGEESSGQIKMRAERTNSLSSEIVVLCETDIDRILNVCDKIKPDIIIADSIQTFKSEELGSVSGTVNQIKFCCYELISYAREKTSSVFLIAHVTKEGIIAGPKVIEHMVDTVLYFDQTDSDLRILRATKNRFGSTNEVGLFKMKEKGLVQVKNPGTVFMVQRKGPLPAGTAAAAVHEGSRILLVEIQALVVPAKGGLSRVYSDRIDTGRVSRTAAVLEKYLSIKFSDQDIYINVAGGIKINEVGIELPLALALYSARTGLALPDDTASAGEISLAGEIRPIPHLQRRIKAAEKMGFKRVMGPEKMEDEDFDLKDYVSSDSIAKCIKAVFEVK